MKSSGRGRWIIGGIIITILASLVLIGLFKRAVPAPDDQVKQLTAATPVFPVRGRQYWRTNHEIENLLNIRQVIAAEEINATWLLQYDALTDRDITRLIKEGTPAAEVGVFLEVTPALAKASFVNYLWETERWERSDKLFLSGYPVADRRRLIDTVMASYHQQFGRYPQSVGAWHIDSWSLDYLQRRYAVTAVLTCADQYLTDGYQIWGQYWGAPYYPSRRNVLEPAATTADLIPVVKLQWAMRDPLKGYGSGPDISNHSTQVNDYARSLQLGASHFPNLVGYYTDGSHGLVSQLTIGLEVGELDARFMPELALQFQLLRQRQIPTQTMSQFAAAYQEVSSGRNLASVIQRADGDRRMTWYNQPLYRLAVKQEGSQSAVVDLRTYNTRSFWETEYWFRDQRQNLLRVVTPVVDQVSLANQLLIETESIQVGPDQVSWTAQDREVTARTLAGCACRVQWEGNRVTLRFTPRTAAAVQPSAILAGLDQVRQWLMPDIRFSQLEGRWVAGLRTSPERLLGYDGTTGQWGSHVYEFPILEAFRRPEQLLSLEGFAVGQDEWEVLVPWLQRRPIQFKNPLYGVGHLEEFYRQRPSFENSKYVVY